MSQTIVSVYDSYQEAQKAATAVKSLGIDADKVRISDDSADSSGTEVSLTEAELVTSRRSLVPVVAPSDQPSRVQSCARLSRS